MKALLYTALDVACIIDNAGLSTKEALRLAHRMHTEDKSFLAVEYRQNYRKWLLDILYWSDYMQDKIALDADFPSVQAVSDGTLDISDLMRDDFDLDLFFQEAACANSLPWEKGLCPYETQDVNRGVWVSAPLEGVCTLPQNSARFLPYSDGAARK